MGERKHGVEVGRSAKEDIVEEGVGEHERRSESRKLSSSVLPNDVLRGPVVLLSAVLLVSVV